MDFNMIGPAMVLALGCLGSSIGCSIAGMACHGVMTHVEEGHGKFIGLSAMPASQAIYAFILMILMKASIAKETLSPMSAMGMGFFVGLALLANSVWQGKSVATAIQATAKQPSLFGKSAIAPSIIEAMALFVFVFSLLLLK